MATVEGSIATLGRQYVLGLRAVNCHSGEVLAEEQVTADSKERVLGTLGEAATKIRRKLGESLASLEKFDAPPEGVTTRSLEALQAYNLGFRTAIVNGNEAAAIPFFQHAISLDRNFAMAYARLGNTYSNLGETTLVADNLRKAYELRDRVSESEKFYIDSHYVDEVLGDVEAARKIYELWAQTYPRDTVPPTNLAAIYYARGEFGKALAAHQDSLKLVPGAAAYANLADNYLSLGRLAEAKATAQEARAHNLDSPGLHFVLYFIDFLERDAAGMEREAAGLMGKPGYENGMLEFESDAAAYAGHFVKAREVTRRAVDSARRADEKEAAAGYQAEAAMREALVGNTDRARQQAQAALALSHGKQNEALSAMGMALAGDDAPATRLTKDLDKRFPKDTIVQSLYLPMIRAAIILAGGSASKEADRAIEALAAALTYEGVVPGPLIVNLYSAYLRGEVYLAAGQAAAAAAEFQRILDHPGLVVNEPIGALAHLGLARAYALETSIPGSAGVPAAIGKQQKAGETPALPSDALAKSRAAYQDFFALWKDADPDIPIFKQAKVEYARLR